MSAEIIELATRRAERLLHAEKREEDLLRKEAAGFSESLQAAVERYRLNLPMMATLLMAKAVDALEDRQPATRTEKDEYDAAAGILRAIVKARSAARAKATADAVRIFNMPTGA